MIKYLSHLEKKEYQYLILFLIIAILYGKTISFENNIDDYIILDSIENKANSFQDLFSLFKLSYNNSDYRPVVFLSFGIEQLIFGELNPAISHVINSILFFLICISGLNLFHVLFSKENNLLIFLSILLFCVHPINTEAVSSIKCRDNLLSLLLSINSTLFFIKYIEHTKRVYYFVAACIFSISAVLSKLDALGFLLFNFCYTLFYKREKKLVYILILVLFVFIVDSTHSYFKENILLKNIDKPLTGKVTFTENPLALAFTTPNRITALINTVFYYFTKLTYISSSKYYYGYNYFQILSKSSFSFFGGIAVILSFISLFIYGLIKQNKILIISIAGISTTSAYALNLLQPVAGIIADRYIFMASIFFCLLVVYIINNILSDFEIKKYKLYISFSVIIIFASISFVRISAWKSFRKLINTDAPKLYHSYEAMRIAAGAYFEEYEKTGQTSDLEQAIFFAEKGNMVYPKNSLLHILSGQYYFKKSDYPKAIQSFKMAANNDTSILEPIVFLGDIYYQSKRLDSALFFYKQALIKQPKSPEFINNISTVYYELGDKEKCLMFNYDLIKSDSSLYAAYENLGYYYLAEKDTTKAKSYFKQAVIKGMNTNDIPLTLQ